MTNFNWYSRSSTLSIVPFDITADMNRGGWIRHGEINQTHLLESIGADVRSLCNMENFTPTWAYIVTYFELKSRQADLKNTFQVLLVSNGNESFAIFNYIRMEWPNSSSKLRNFEAGFYFRDNTLHITKKYLIENTTLSNLVTGSNMGRPGRWFISFNHDNCRVNYSYYYKSFAPFPNPQMITDFERR